MLNPLTELKVQSKVTFKELTSMLAVSTSVIQRTMEGCYSQIPPNLLESMAEISSESIRDITRQYNSWQAQELRYVQLPVGEPYMTMTIDESEVWFSMLLMMNGSTSIVNGLSIGKILKLHPAVLNNWLDGLTQQLPVGVLERVQLIRQLQEGADNGD